MRSELVRLDVARCRELRERLARVKRLEAAVARAAGLAMVFSPEDVTASAEYLRLLEALAAAAAAGPLRGGAFAELPLRVQVLSPIHHLGFRAHPRGLALRAAARDGWEFMLEKFTDAHGSIFPENHSSSPFLGLWIRQCWPAPEHATYLFLSVSAAARRRRRGGGGAQRGGGQH